MKIDSNDLILKNLYPVAKTSPQTGSDQKFGDLLKERTENSTISAAETRQGIFINPLDGVQINSPVEFDSQFALECTENLIGLLDQYRRQLADPAMTLKNMDPIIREINQATENLVPVFDSLPEGEVLKNIVNQTLVTASLEVGKFYRGDYIDG